MRSASAERWLVQTSLFIVATICIPSIPMAEAFGIPDFLEFGECANSKNQPQLDLTRYSGIWFSQELVPNEYSEIETCSMTNYTWKGDMMKVVERGLSSEKRKVRQNFIIRPSEEEGLEGEFVVIAEGVPSAPFQIVATDYDNYACAYSCMSFMGFRAAFSWIYTRKPDADHSYVELCRDLLAEQGVNPTALKPMKQAKDCPYMSKLPRILEYSEGVQRKAKANAQEKLAKAKADKTQKEHVVIESHDSTLPEEIQLLEEVEKRLQEEGKQLLHDMEEERHRQEEERRRMEEERQREEQERRRMEEERQREQEERRRMEEARHSMEEEKTMLEDERREMEKERRKGEEEITELREDVRAEIRRNHRGSRHRTELAEEEAENKSNQHSTSLATLLIALSLSAFIAL